MTDTQTTLPPGEWFRDPAFWEVMRPFTFPEARLDAAAREVASLLALLESSGTAMRPGARVLDLPCGPGRHAVELARRGYEVTGYDLMPRHVEQARTRAADAGVHARFEVADMYACPLEPGAYDVVLNLFTSIGYSEHEADDMALVRRVHDALRPGGVFVIDTKGKEVLARAFESRRYHELDGWVVHETVRVVDAWRRVVVTLTFLRDGEERTASFAHRIFGASDLARLLEAAGFDVAFHGALDGRPYDQDALRLIAVATKGAT